MIVIIFGFLLFETSLIFQIYSFNKQQHEHEYNYIIYICQA